MVAVPTGFAAVIGSSDHVGTPSNKLGVELFLCLSTIFLALVSINTFIRSSDILIDETGIRLVVFGKERNKVAWPDVKRIRLWIAPGLGRPMNTYTLDTTLDFRLPYDTKHPVFVVNDRIENARELYDIINVYVRKHHIPVVNRRTNQTFTHLTTFTFGRKS